MTPTRIRSLIQLKRRSTIHESGREARRGTLRRRLGDGLELLGYHALALLARSFPLALQQRVLAAVAHLLILVGERRARWALVNLGIAYPHTSKRWRLGLARRSYTHLAWNALDQLRMRRWSAEQVRERVELQGLENLRAALAEGRGAILAVPHLGNFELGLQAVALAGIECTVVVRIPRNRWLGPEFLRVHSAHGVHALPQEGALLKLTEALRKGRTVVITHDQYSRRTSRLFVPFFGVRVPTSSAVAMLAMRTGAPVLPCGVIRVGPDRHRGLILAPIAGVRSVDRRATQALLTVRYAAALEALIRRYPEHWMWTYRRFRHSPDLPGDPYAR